MVVRESLATALTGPGLPQFLARGNLEARPRTARPLPRTPAAVTWLQLVRMRAAGARCCMQQTVSRPPWKLFRRGLFLH